VWASPKFRGFLVRDKRTKKKKERKRKGKTVRGLLAHAASTFDSGRGAEVSMTKFARAFSRLKCVRTNGRHVHRIAHIASGWRIHGNDDVLMRRGLCADREDHLERLRRIQEDSGAGLPRLFRQILCCLPLKLPVLLFSTS